mgnify:CR=1 FL=1
MLNRAQVPEVMVNADLTAGRLVELLLFAGAVYFVLCFALSRLVQRLLNDVSDDFDDLPVMQHALSRTWAQWAAACGGSRPVDLEDYAATGGAASALDGLAQWLGTHSIQPIRHDGGTEPAQVGEDQAGWQDALVGGDGERALALWERALLPLCLAFSLVGVVLGGGVDAQGAAMSATEVIVLLVMLWHLFALRSAPDHVPARLMMVGCLVLLFWARRGLPPGWS